MKVALLFCLLIQVQGKIYSVFDDEFEIPIDDGSADEKLSEIENFDEFEELDRMLPQAPSKEPEDASSTAKDFMPEEKISLKSVSKVSTSLLPEKQEPEVVTAVPKPLISEKEPIFSESEAKPVGNLSNKELETEIERLKEELAQIVKSNEYKDSEEKLKTEEKKDEPQVSTDDDMGWQEWLGLAGGGVGLTGGLLGLYHYKTARKGTKIKLEIDRSTTEREKVATWDAMQDNEIKNLQDLRTVGVRSKKLDEGFKRIKFIRERGASQFEIRLEVDKVIKEVSTSVVSELLGKEIPKKVSSVLDQQAELRAKRKVFEAGNLYKAVTSEYELAKKEKALKEEKIEGSLKNLRAQQQDDFEIAKEKFKGEDDVDKKLKDLERRQKNAVDNELRRAISSKEIIIEDVGDDVDESGKKKSWYSRLKNKMWKSSDSAGPMRIAKPKKSKSK
jgi:hypothetical protein